MKGVRKAFSKDLHARHDVKAREQAKAFWRSKGFHVADNPNTKGVDLILMDSETEEIVGYVEVEVKNNWNNKAFQYETLQLPERKGKYIDQYGSKITYMVYSKDLTQAFLISSLILKRSPLVEVSNRFVRKGEYFYQVPVQKCRLVSMGDE
jgi:arginine/ornithine N-succinyltransferase beta subunit